MAINLDRFNPSSRANSHRNHNDNSNKPAIERMLTNLFESHAPDDTGSFLPQDLIPLADWEVLPDVDASASVKAEVVALPNEEVLTDGHGATSESEPQAPSADSPGGSTSRANFTTTMPDDDKATVHAPKTEQTADPVVEGDGLDEQVDVTGADTESAEVDTSEAEQPPAETTEADAFAEDALDLKPNAADEPDAEQVTSAPDDADRTMAATFSPTLVRLPVPPKRGSVPKFLSDFEARENPNNTTMRPLPYYNFNWMNEGRSARNNDIADFDDYDEIYDEDFDDGFDSYDDQYDEYEDRYEYDEDDERGIRRKPLIALVAAVAVISFIAGGAVARLSSQVPVLFGEKAETNETQASYSGKTSEQALPDQAPAPEEVPHVQTEPQTVTPQTPTEQQTPTEPTDAIPNPPSYDTGDDTTDDWGNTDSQQDYEQTQNDEPQSYEESPESSDQDSSDNAWQWNLDQDGNSSISYDQEGNEVTFNYDGYQLTVPIGELVGYGRPDTSSPYDNDTTYENDSTSNQRNNDYGTGYDTEEDRDRDLWSYRPQSYIWS